MKKLIYLSMIAAVLCLSGCKSGTISEIMNAANPPDLTNNVMTLTLGDTYTQEDLSGTLEEYYATNRFDTEVYREANVIQYVFHSSVFYTAFNFGGYDWNSISFLLTNENKLYQVEFKYFTSDPKRYQDDLVRDLIGKYGKPSRVDDNITSWYTMTNEISVSRSSAYMAGSTRDYVALDYYNRPLANEVRNQSRSEL